MYELMLSSFPSFTWCTVRKRLPGILNTPSSLRSVFLRLVDNKSFLLRSEADTTPCMSRQKPAKVTPIHPENDSLTDRWQWPWWAWPGASLSLPTCLGTPFQLSPTRGPVGWCGALPASKLLIFHYLTGQRSLGIKLCFGVWDPQVERARPSQTWTCCHVCGE